MMRPTLTHVAVHVPDLDACVAFYQQFCAMQVIHQRAGKGAKIAARARSAGCLVWEPCDEPFPVGYYCGLRDPAGN
jgi:catechol 2,3-dioxygenase-like lactoylglutathione lyase family enzyme